MPSRAELTIRVDCKEGYVTYKAFSTVMNNTIGILRNISRGMGAEDPLWAITKATMSSPMEITLAAVEDKKPRLRRKVVRNYVQGLRAIENNEAPPRSFVDQDYELAKKIVSVLTDGVRELRFSSEDGGEVTPTQHLAANAQAIQEKLFHYEWTSFRGVLENIVTHADRNVFSIFDALTDEEIPCHFPEERTKEVGSMIKQRVYVYGRARYDRSGKAIDIHVEEFRRLRGEDELTKISEAEPVDITGGMDSVEYVRKIRNGEPL